MDFWVVQFHNTFYRCGFHSMNSCCTQCISLLLPCGSRVGSLDPISLRLRSEKVASLCYGVVNFVCHYGCNLVSTAVASHINIIMRVHTTSLVRVCIHTVIVRYAYQKYASHSYLYIQHCTTICIHMLYDVQIHIDMCLSSMLSAYTRTVMVSKIAHAFSTRVPAHCSSGLESPYLGALGCVPSLSEA